MSLLCSIGLTPSPARDVAEVRGVQQHRLLASLVDGPSRTDTPLVGRFDPPRGVDPVALLESHLASGWPYDVATVIDAVMGLPIVSEIWPSGERPSTHELLDELACGICTDHAIDHLRPPR